MRIIFENAIKTFLVEASKPILSMIKYEGINETDIYKILLKSDTMGNIKIKVRVLDFLIEWLEDRELISVTRIELPNNLTRRWITAHPSTVDDLQKQPEAGESEDFTI